VQAKWKVLIGIGVLSLIGGGGYASVKYSQRDIVTIQTGKVIQEDLASVVTASAKSTRVPTSALARSTRGS